jgi:hypothetical protein
MHINLRIIFIIKNNYLKSSLLNYIILFGERNDFYLNLSKRYYPLSIDDIH